MGSLIGSDFSFDLAVARMGTIGDDDFRPDCSICWYRYRSGHS